MRKQAIYIVFIFLLILGWHYLGSSSSNARILISTPKACIEYFAENSSALWEATLVTTLESFLGLTIATAFAFTLMLICFRFKSFYNLILPVILTTQVIPLITLAPFFILWLGIGISSKIALSAVICFYPIFLNFATGYRAIPSNVFDLMEIYKAKLTFKIINVYFPISLPNIFTGLKVAATLSVIGAIVAEFSGTDIGLGKNLLFSAMRIEPELMMISIFLSAIVGGSLFGLIYIIERITGKWYLSTQQLLTDE